MKKIFTAVLIAFALVQAKAQLIVVSPEFPLVDEPATIVFDATLGNAGLASYTGDVYAHTGVLTTASTSPSDWKHVKTQWGENTSDTRMTKIGDHTYQLEIKPSIREYYGIGADEKVTDLAFVFRSAEPYSGTSYYEGKDVGNKDIFYPVYEAGLSISINSPGKQTLVSPNDQVSFTASSSKDATLKLYQNSTLVKTANGTGISNTFTFTTTGDYWLKVVATTADETAADSVFVGVIGDQPVAQLPPGMVDGVNYLSADSVCLVLYAPGKQSVFLTGDFNDWTPYGNYRANLDGDRFWLKIGGLTPGKEYAYQYFVDGKLNIADPYTDKVLDPVNDQWIPDSVYPNLKPYPYGLANGIVSVFQTNKSPYQWQNNDFTPPSPEKLVIYELLVRDFVAAHDWQTLADTLDYFTRLGINAIEVMPFNEFEGNESWGYNPSFYFAPDKYYGPEHDLKAFIDSCHGRGIAVIQDLVLNHSYGQSPLVQLYFDSATNQPAADNPWYNQTSPNPNYSWGYDFNHESPQTKAFVDRVNRYWMENFRIDGYRFDFTKGFTNTPGDGSFVDPSRIAILERMADSIWAVKPDQYIILEHFAPNTEEIQLSNHGMMLWDKENCTYGQCTMGYPSGPECNWDIGGISYLNRGWTDPHLVSYMESHDEERLMYKNLTWGNSSGDYDIKDLSTALRRVEEAAAMFFTVPGPKMIWQFEEVGYDYSIDYNGRTGNKPIRWDLVTYHKRTFAVFQTLIKLRQEQPVFNTGDFTMNVNGPFKQLALNDTSMDVRVIANFDVVNQQGDPAFSRTGYWYDYLSGDTLDVTDLNAPIELEPGEYHIYTTKPLSTPNLPLSVFTRGAGNEKPVIYPNPASDRITIKTSERIDRIEVYDISNRLVKEIIPGNNNCNMDISGFTNGMYILKIKTSKGMITGKVIKYGN